MKNLILTVTSLTLLALAPLTQARHDQDHHFTRDNACKILESTRMQVETELRDSANLTIPQLQVEGAVQFGVDYSSTQVDIQASNSNPASVR